MKILGLDPGTVRIGYGLIRARRKDFQFISSGILDIKSKEKNKRFLDLSRSLTKIIKKERPDCAVMEKLFFIRNRTTAIEVAQAQGVLTFVVAKHKIPLIEFTPLEIKHSLTGYGFADKTIVAKAVFKVLRIKKVNGGDDACDALAAAIVGSGFIQTNKGR